MNINTIIFDFGGVIVRLSSDEAVKRFRELGLADAQRRLDKYHQSGIFGDLEEGKITAGEFQDQLSRLVGRTLTHQECAYAWQGYVAEVPENVLKALTELRRQGYRLLLLSNTNPFMMEWAMSSRFDGKGHPVNDYFDKLYLSYQLKMMKPDERVFRQLLMDEDLTPGEVVFIDDGPRNVAVASQLGMTTICPGEDDDWTVELKQLLKTI